MYDLASFYKKPFGLEEAALEEIDHDDAIVAVVYKVIFPSKRQILKICLSKEDYFREVYFLKYFANKLPVPRMIQTTEPEGNIHGAVLMEFLEGELLQKEGWSDSLAHEVGACLATVHTHRVAGYGDLTKESDLVHDPKVCFGRKFKEELAECSSHLSTELIEKCHSYYDHHLKLLDFVDGPCMIHRDFRPANIIVSDGKLRGIIDWSSGRGGFAEQDFCSLEHAKCLMNDSQKRFFLKGYESIRPVPKYGVLMPLLRLGRALATIGFTIKNDSWENSNARLYQYNLQFLESLL